MNVKNLDEIIEKVLTKIELNDLFAECVNDVLANKCVIEESQKLSKVSKMKCAKTDINLSMVFLENP